MSARDELFNDLRQWMNASEQDEAVRLLDAYRAEVLREAADVIGALADAHSDYAQEVLSGVEYGEAEDLLRRMAEGNENRGANPIA